MSKTILRSNCPRDCYDGCGMIIEVSGDGPVRVLGDPDHPVSRGRLCSKCAVAYNGVWQDETARLQFPLRRIGSKGSGRFERVSWDEATEEIAARLKKIVADHGADAVLHTHYSGTLSLIALLFPMRFFHRLGAAEVDPDTICNAAGHKAWDLMFGDSNTGFDPRTADDANCLLLWGVNPSATGPHTHRYWFAESPATKVVVDPLRTETAQCADIHLQPRPGTDAALAFGLLHLLHRAGKFDNEFIARHVLGADEVMPLIERATPSRTAALTGVPEDLIDSAAQAYGAGPALLWAGQGLQRQQRGGNIMRAIGLLPALTGKIGKPGCGFYYINDTPSMAGLDMAAVAGAGLLKSAPQSIGHMDLAPELARADRFRALLIWNTNPLASAPNQAQLRTAMAREDLFTVVVDCFQTDSADFADFILPAASFLEFDDLTFSYFHLNLGVQSKAREPLGESLPNQEIFRRLAAAMGYTEPELFESDAELMARMLDQMGIEGGFDALQRRGHVSVTPETLQLYSQLQFKTPSGRIEIASASAEQLGLPHIPNDEIDEPAVTDRFRLITPGSDLRMNDSYANDPKLAERAGVAAVVLHPADAGRLQIRDGDRVLLENEAGALELQARVEALALPGVLVAYKGRWPKLEAARANVNTLHTAHAADMAGSTSVHSTLVRLRPV